MDPTLEQVEASNPAFEGLTAFYRNELQPYLEEQEAARSAAHAKFKQYAYAVLPLGAAGLGLVWFLDGFSSGWIGFAAAAVIVVTVIGVLAYHGSSIFEIVDEVKQESLARLCRFLGFTYNAEPQSADLGKFRSNHVIPSFDRRSLEDEILGVHEDVSFQLCEALLEDKRTRRDSDGRTETYYVTVFRGLLAEFTFPKTFVGRTIITTDGGVIGNFFSGFGSKGERIRLEDPRFEKLFEVHSDDQVEARYLLTPTFMERICELADLVGGKLQLALVGQRLLLTVNGGDDRFEGAGMFKPTNDPSMIARMAKEIGLVFDIIHTLRLNARTRT